MAHISSKEHTCNSDLHCLWSAEIASEWWNFPVRAEQSRRSPHDCRWTADGIGRKYSESYRPPLSFEDSRWWRNKASTDKIICAMPSRAKKSLIFTLWQENINCRREKYPLSKFENFLRLLYDLQSRQRETKNNLSATGFTGRSSAIKAFCSLGLRAAMMCKISQIF